MSTLLSKEFLRHLEGISLLLRRPVAGHLRGQHRSRRTGSGMIFADYRPYSSGDDIRNLDWATYMRLDRLVLRMFEEEADTPIYIFIDNSASMGGEASRKLKIAKKLAAVLAYAGLLNHDRVSLISFSDGVVKEMPGRRGKNHMWRAMHFLDSLKNEGQTNLANTFRRFFGTGRTRGLVFVISDFLLEQTLEDSFRPLIQYGHDVFAGHIIAPEEESPSLNGQVVLVDSETREALNAQVTETMLATYRMEFNKYRANTEQFFKHAGWSYVSLRTDVDFEASVLTALKKEGMFR
ncbi:MAG: DUF58 domain-containing protein [Proteobacteria bacterium]|nr:DUF58 domain-containing protein [Pseudomonadota bacterium]MDA1331054.1 DUF58 domain-containing protein [Pseudomonadota bacterium]